MIFDLFNNTPARGALTAAMIATLVIACAPADAANSIPEVFQGHWQPDLDVAASHITETNYECDIRKIRLVPADPSVDRTQRVKTLWAIRKTSAGDVLVITTLPNKIQVFQRN
jgi:hypothetical protein